MQVQGGDDIGCPWKECKKKHVSLWVTCIISPSDTTAHLTEMFPMYGRLDILLNKQRDVLDSNY